jgi:membrane associated rhomboid family serine protease
MTELQRTDAETEAPTSSDGEEDGSPAEAGRAPLPHSWAELYPPRPKPEWADYGFLSAHGSSVASTREDLLHRVRTRALPSLVWTPETARMVPPWEVPYLLDVMRAEVRARDRRQLRNAALVGGGLLLGLWLLAEPEAAAVISIPVVLLLALFLAPAIRRVRREISADELRRGFDAMVEQQAEEAIPIPATRRLAYAVGAATVVQLVGFQASIEAGALRADAVAAGEWWRLLTAPMLHGGVLHFWMNFAALETLGRTMETRGPSAWVPIVFLASAVAGGTASLALPPDVASVGASGGLMGMFGFLAVMAYRRKRHLPEGFLRGLLINIALIALVGAVAYRFIDNAAHAGGLFAGVLIGLAAIPGDEDVAGWTGGPLLRRAGLAATAVLWLAAATAIVLTLTAAFGG